MIQGIDSCGFPGMTRRPFLARLTGPFHLPFEGIATEWLAGTGAMAGETCIYLTGMVKMYLTAYMALKPALTGPICSRSWASTVSGKQAQKIQWAGWII